MSLAFAAISRTGCDPARHVLFEVAVVTVAADGAEQSFHWAMRPDRLTDADADELVRTRYYPRWDVWQRAVHPSCKLVAVTADACGVEDGDDDDVCVPVDALTVVDQLTRVLLGAQLMTLGLDREAEFLTAYLHQRGRVAGWTGHYDITAAAAGAMSGYAQGWETRGRRDGLLDRAAGVDLAAATLPHDPFRLARAIGVKPAGDPASAYTRARMAREMYAILAAPLRPAPVPAPLVDPATPPPAPPAPAASSSASSPTGDGEFDRVVTVALAPSTGPFGAAARQPLEPREDPYGNVIRPATGWPATPPPAPTG